MKHLYIFGTGGFGREALVCFIDICESKNLDYTKHVSFVVDDAFHHLTELMGIPVLKRSQLNSNEGEFFIAIADPFLRKELVRTLPTNTVYATLIHPSANVSAWVTLGEGSIVCAGSILTTQIEVGKHAHINLNTTIGHDCKIGNFFTSSPGVNVSGNCTINDNVFIGTNSAIRDKLTICDDVVIGMSTSVIKSIDEPGIYIGSPASKINL